MEGAPVYYFAREPNCAPFGKTLGKHNLVTTILSLRDPIYDTIEAEDDLYSEKCGSKLVSRHFSGVQICIFVLFVSLIYFASYGIALCGPDAR